MKCGPLAAFLLATSTIFTIASLGMIANAEDAASRLQKITSVNSLDFPGKTPYHLKMSFQVYDLAGKPTDTGILEEWWAAPGQSRITIIAASLKHTQASVLDDSLSLDPRERYLVEELLRAETHPLPSAPRRALDHLEEAKRQIGETKLRCFDTPALDYSLATEKPEPRPPLTFCIDPGTDTLLLEFTDRTGHTIARKDLSAFHETSIPLETAVSYSGRPAIVGKIFQINALDSAAKAESFSFLHAAGLDNTQHHWVWAKPNNCYSPAWPEHAWFNHETGFVTLSGTVTKAGAVKDIVIIGSSSNTFNTATIEAFRKCKYKPALVDGEPTEDRVVFQGDFTAVNHSGIVAFSRP